MGLLRPNGNRYAVRPVGVANDATARGIDMRKPGLGMVGLAALGLLAACGNTDTTRAASGGAAGALGGAVVGGPIGAVVGGAGGAAAGASMEEGLTAEDFDLEDGDEEVLKDDGVR
jgi:hypothetical protein